MHACARRHRPSRVQLRRRHGLIRHQGIRRALLIPLSPSSLQPKFKHKLPSLHASFRRKDSSSSPPPQPRNSGRPSRPKSKHSTPISSYESSGAWHDAWMSWMSLCASLLVLGHYRLNDRPYETHDLHFRVGKKITTTPAYDVFTEAMGSEWWREATLRWARM